MFGKDLSRAWTGKFNMKRVQKTYDVLVKSRDLDPNFDVKQVIFDSLLPK